MSEAKGKDAAPAHNLLRPEDADHAPVGYAELFFDLVYVFAVTQLSHYLLAHQTLSGMLQGALLFLAVWWAWAWMVWATNWLDPERGAVRMMVFAVMLAGLAMSASIPKAFGAAGTVFAIAYIGTMIARTAFVAWALRSRAEASRNLWRAVVWMVASVPLWAAGALAEGYARLAWWAGAVALNYAAPLVGFRVPGMGKSDTHDFGISGSHMAERCALFIIIALGEGILVTGATFAELAWTAETVAAVAIAFTGSVAMWWIYFDRGAKRGAEHIEGHDDAGRVARDAFTYLHLPIVAGIVVSAVADELLLAHPTGHASPAFIAASVLGPAVFVAGCMVFKRATGSTDWLPMSHLVGLALFGLVALWSHLAHPAPLAIGGTAVAVLGLVALWEWRSFHGGWSDAPVPERMQ